MNLTHSKRIVIKVGSSLLIDADDHIRKSWIATLAEDIAALKKEGRQVIIVTSGAVALGRRALGYDKKGLLLEEKQAAAACGQTALMAGWAEAFQKNTITPAQILLTIDDSENRRRYLNARNTLETLLASEQVIPVINENDTVATSELRFGDNDRLAARVAQMVGADTLILFSDIEGLYTSNPHVNPNAEFVAEVKDITADIESMAGAVTSNVGSGGMVTKIMAAKLALAAGCHMAITSGKEEHPLKKLWDGGKATWFIASSTPTKARKHWIAGSIASTGIITVDDGASDALKNSKSLLPAGVKKVEGRFDRGDAVIVKNLQGKDVAKGLITYSSDDAIRIIGRKSQEIEQILGFKGRNVLIHRDDLVLL
jgi:glutamate 5-kinase